MLSTTSKMHLRTSLRRLVLLPALSCYTGYTGRSSAAKEPRLVSSILIWFMKLLSQTQTLSIPKMSHGPAVHIISSGLQESR